MHHILHFLANNLLKLSNFIILYAKCDKKIMAEFLAVVDNIWAGGGGG